MTDEAKLRIAALRWAHLHGDCNDEDNTCPVQDECLRCTNVLCNTRTAANLIESLSAELEQVKRERDAAVEDLRTHGMLCVLCLNEKKSVNTEPCKSCSHASTSNRHTNWQWRGVKEEPHD